MKKISFSLLRGVCQIPAYIAHNKGFFRDEGIDVDLNIEPTAWMVPYKLNSGTCQFAVIPWTRVVSVEERDKPFVIISGSGYEEAAIVVKRGIDISEVKKICIPQRGGMKDLTAMALIKSLHLENIELIRQPSGDGAIISLFGQGADAASMVEPYATMMECLDIGKVVRRTGDVWPGVPGCSLTTTREFRENEPETVNKVVRAFVKGAFFIRDNIKETAEIATSYIGINESFIEKALKANKPNVYAIKNQKAMDEVISFMVGLGYIKEKPKDYIDLTFLNRALENLQV